MGPDLKAARWLAEAYLKQGKAADAVRMCEKVIESNPDAVSGELASVYWDALIGAEQFAKLKKALGDAVAKGNRQVAAVAQIKRGDLEKKQGRNKEALIDGYLRTVVLFQDVKEVQPEALFKAAKCFEELGQMSHADKMRKKLLAEFPADPYSQQLKTGA
jgi:tetratricopeptide (TPR) repeat protein